MILEPTDNQEQTEARNNAPERAMMRLERYNRLLDSTDEGIYGVDTKGRCTYINRAGAAMLGYAPDEIIGKNVHALTHFQRPDGTAYPVEDCPIYAVLRGGPACRRDDEAFWRRNGTSFPIEYSSAPIVEDGEVVGASVTFTDITDRKRHEHAMRELTARNAAILHAALDCIIIMDHQGTVLEFNPAAERTFGYTREEAVGRHLADLIIPPAYRDAHWRGLRHYVAMGEGPILNQRLELTALRADGGEFPVELAISPIEVDGLPVFTAYLRDITERKRIETDLRGAKEAAEAAVIAKSQFLATMSHEIRTPMNAVIGMTGLLLDTELSVEQREYAQIVRDSGDALLTIINDILDYSKIEAGQLELEHQPFDLRECIESALDLVTARAADKDIDLAYVIAPGTIEAVLGDVTRVRQILVNLLSNAVKFTDKGEVVLSLESRSMEGEAEEGKAEAEKAEDGKTEEKAEKGKIGGRQELHFAVRDTGIGIPPDRLDRLFRSFSQVDASTTRRFGGTGLGLAISKRLTEIIGGRIWVESEEGKGSTFHVALNLDASPMPVRTAIQINQPHLEGKRVLIVDDNATNRQILTLQAQSWGMIPFASADGPSALDMVRRQTPLDIAILDIQMPGMDGLTLAHEIRQVCSPRELPIVGLSSVGPKLAEVAAAGLTAMLTKPIKQSQLFNVLAELFADLPQPAPPDTSAPVYDAALAQRLPLRVLIAEDLAVNQKLLLSLLRKFGYRADVAANGLEALKALERQSYDLILMDVQMPEMDGLEASRVIGKRYGSEARPRIVALTANAMREDQEICRAAGMDDYLSKPLNPHALEAALRRWGEWTQEQKRRVLNPPQSEEHASSEAGGQPLMTEPGSAANDFAGEPTMDPALLADYADMPDVMAELLDAFRADAVPFLARMRDAAASGDAGALRQAAHGIKGAAGNLGGRRLAALCGALEALGREGTTVGASALLPQAEAEFERLCAVMAQGAQV